MFKQYVKQDWQIIKTNPLVSTISILGSALAIAMIMGIMICLGIFFPGQQAVRVSASDALREE